MHVCLEVCASYKWLSDDVQLNAVGCITAEACMQQHVSRANLPPFNHISRGSYFCHSRPAQQEPSEEPQPATSRAGMLEDKRMTRRGGGKQGMR